MWKLQSWKKWKFGSWQVQVKVTWRKPTRSFSVVGFLSLYFRVLYSFLYIWFLLSLKIQVLCDGGMYLKPHPSTVATWLYLNAWAIVTPFWLFLNNFIYLFLCVLGLCCCMRAFSTCGSQVLGHSLNGCGTGAQLLCGMWNPPGSGVEPMSPALAGRFLPTAPPGKSETHFFFFNIYLFGHVGS